MESSLATKSANSLRNRGCILKLFQFPFCTTEKVHPALVSLTNHGRLLPPRIAAPLTEKLPQFWGKSAWVAALIFVWTPKTLMQQDLPSSGGIMSTLSPHSVVFRLLSDVKRGKLYSETSTEPWVTSVTSMHIFPVPGKARWKAGKYPRSQYIIQVVLRNVHCCVKIFSTVLFVITVSNNYVF